MVESGLTYRSGLGPPSQQPTIPPDRARPGTFRRPLTFCESGAARCAGREKAIMDWGSILTMACVGAAGGLLGALVAIPLKALGPRVRQIAVTAAVAISIVVGNTVAVPQVREWRARAKADEVFNQHRIFLLLEKDHPEIRAQFAAMIVPLAVHGKSSVEAQAFAWGETTLGKHLADYIPRASDDVLLEYVTFMVELLDHLRAQSADACFVFLFGEPEAKRELIISDAELRKKMLALSTRVVESAMEDPRPVPGSSDTDVLMDQVLERLISKHGPEFVRGLEQIETPQAPSTDRKQVCHVVRELYHEAVSLGPPSSARVLRAMLSN
jgi:hypothetical protein